MTGGRWGRWCVVVGAAAVVLTLTGCTQASDIAIGFEGGRPRILACNWWVSGVRVTDPVDGDVVWEVKQDRFDDLEEAIVIGELPSSEWSERTHWTRKRPDIWRLEIDARFDDPWVVLVDADDLSDDTVMTRYGDRITTREFREGRCGEGSDNALDELAAALSIFIAAATGLGGIALLVVHQRRHGERMRQIHAARGGPPP